MSNIVADALQACFPGLEDKEAMDLLWNETCFPFGDSERIREDIHEARLRRTIRPGYCEMDGWYHHSERK